MSTRLQYASVVTLGLLLAVAPLLAQVLGPAATPPASTTPPPPATGVIAGTVADAATGAPISGAVVYLNREIRDSITFRQARQFTDSKGRFAFVELPPSDSYLVTAGQFGYFDGGSSASGEAGTIYRTVALADGQWVTDHRVTLQRPAGVSGMVTDETGEPLAGIYVRVLARISVAGRFHLASGPSATTDDRGVYRIGNLPPGQYIVAVPGVSQSVQTADLPSGVGAPGGNTMMSGGIQAPGYSVPAPEAALDLGATTRLLLGRFAVPPPPHDGRVFAYPMAFYGGVGDIARAVPLDLTLGEERSGLDIKLEPAAATTISGVVQGSAESLARLTLRLLPAGLEDTGEGNEAATAAVAADGSFTFFGVTPGNYILEAPAFIGEYLMNSSIFGGRPPTRLSGGASSGSVPAGPPGTQFMRGRSRSDSSTFARLPITVATRPLTGVVVTLKAAASISGTLALDMDPGQPGAKPPTYNVVRAEPANGVPSLGQGDNGQPDRSTGDFVIEGLLAGAYLIRANAPAPWQVKSVTIGGRDVTHQAIDTSGGRISGLVVTLTNRPVEIAGTVRDTQGALAPDSVVVLFPAEPSQWTDYGQSAPRFRSVTVRNDGTYRLKGVPAGEYLAVALPGTNTRAWQVPGFFKRVESAATRVTIGWGETRTQDLRVGSAATGGGLR